MKITKKYEQIRTETARQLMSGFSEETNIGTPGNGWGKRYLWTDAFAVCNFLELHRLTGEKKFLDTVRILVDEVHHSLGKHRKDDPRSGWISGLNDKEGEKHPTSGGLRIGKRLNERKPEEPFDPQLEWERDGQYFHYLTKWMHALTQTGKHVSEQVYTSWASELARVAEMSFTYTASNEIKRMYWKMSIDLTGPLVPSMGQHDPIDGLITLYEIDSAASSMAETSGLDREITELEEICRNCTWESTDPLGIGGLLFDSYRLAQLIDKGYTERQTLLRELLAAALNGIRLYEVQSRSIPISYRLAFRELGLSISLHSIPEFMQLVESSSRFDHEQNRILPLLAELNNYRPLLEKIETTWLSPENRNTPLWLEHEKINTVMLAASLVPDGFLRI